MKRLLKLYTRIFIVLFFGIIFLSCSDNEELGTKLQEKDLVGTLWNLKKYSVRKDGVGGYRLELYEEETCSFRENGVLVYPDRFGSAGKYRVSNEVLYLDWDAYKIRRFTGKYIELISEDDLNSEIARDSGYGFRYKYELRKL
jgi:lipoprotein